MGTFALPVALLLVFLSVACHTPVKDPGRERAERKNTFGFSADSSGGSANSATISYSKNLNQKISLRSSFSHDWAPRAFNIDLANGTELMSSTQDQTYSRSFKEKRTGISSGMLYFPWRSQFIFTGTQISVGRYHTAYIQDSNDLSPNLPAKDVEFF